MVLSSDFFFLLSLADLPGGFCSLFFSAGIKMARDTRMSHWVKMSSVFSFSFSNWIFVETHGYYKLKKCGFLPERWFYNSILMRSDFQAYGTIELRNSEIPWPGFGSLPTGRIKSASQSFKLQVKTGSSQMLKSCSEVVRKQSQ